MFVPNKDLLQPSITVRFFLKNIFGIGFSRNRLILKNYGLYGNTTMSYLSSLLYKKFISYIDNNYVTEKSLSNITANKLKREWSLLSVRGWKLHYHLPINGQKSRTNAGTSKRLSIDYHSSTSRERKKTSSIKKNFYLIKNSKERRKSLRKHMKKFKKKR